MKPKHNNKFINIKTYYWNHRVLDHSSTLWLSYIYIYNIYMIYTIQYTWYIQHNIHDIYNIHTWDINVVYFIYICSILYTCTYYKRNISITTFLLYINVNAFIWIYIRFIIYKCCDIFMYNTIYFLLQHLQIFGYYSKNYSCKQISFYMIFYINSI